MYNRTVTLEIGAWLDAEGESGLVFALYRSIKDKSGKAGQHCSADPNILVKGDL